MRVLTSQLELVSLDAKDWRILREIIHNYRQPLSSIAKTCLLSRQSVEYRLKMMHEHNLLRGSRTVINIQKLGYKSDIPIAKKVSNEVLSLPVHEFIREDDLNDMVLKIKEFYGSSAS